ncbi:30S ribosomal protein S3 [bacterium HR24]|jgi:small subunit ribosomal protein S3|nr:30S ribosomal protein S3 [bacterium HR24]
MGHKVHPTGLRIGIIYDWQSKWFSDKDPAYRELLHEDLAIRNTITGMLRDAAISRVEIERNANQVTVTIHTARPGIVIGRGGQRVEEIRNRLEEVTGKRVRVNITEVPAPELDARLVAQTIARQIEQRISHRRAIKQAAARAMQRGALGVKIRVAGRLGGADMSRKAVELVGRVPLHTLRADIDYGLAEARTPLGVIGVKVWIYKGDVLPERELAEVAEAAAEVSEGASTQEG